MSLSENSLSFAGAMHLSNILSTFPLSLPIIIWASCFQPAACVCECVLQRFIKLSGIPKRHFGQQNVVHLNKSYAKHYINLWFIWPIPPDGTDVLTSHSVHTATPIIIWAQHSTERRAYLFLVTEMWYAFERRIQKKRSKIALSFRNVIDFAKPRQRQRIKDQSEKILSTTAEM